MPTIILLAAAIIAVFLAVLHLAADEPIATVLWVVVAVLAYGFRELVRVLERR